VPIPLSLGVIIALIGGTMLLSLVMPPKVEAVNNTAGDGASNG
jgi:hypothetical protein